MNRKSFRLGLLVVALVAVVAAVATPARALFLVSVASVQGPSTIQSNNTYTVTVNLSETVNTDTLVAITATGPGEYTVPSQVTVLSGQSSVSFDLETGAAPPPGPAQGVTVKATIPGSFGPEGAPDTCQALWAD